MAKKKNFFGLYPQDEDKFAGEYIAIVKGKIVAHGKNPGDVCRKANKFSSKPLLTVVPCGGWRQMRVLSDCVTITQFCCLGN